MEKSTVAGFVQQRSMTVSSNLSLLRFTGSWDEGRVVVFFVVWSASSPSKLFSVLCLVSGFSGWTGQMKKPVETTKEQWWNSVERMHATVAGGVAVSGEPWDTEPSLAAQIKGTRMLGRPLAACSHPALHVQAKQVTGSSCKVINRSFPLSAFHANTLQTKKTKPSRKQAERRENRTVSPSEQFCRLLVVIKPWQYRREASCFHSVAYL